MSNKVKKVTYCFTVQKDTRNGTIKATYIGLSDVLRNATIAIIDDDSCAFTTFERTGYRNWFITFGDVLALDLMHHESIKSNKTNVYLGDPDYNYMQSTCDHLPHSFKSFEQYEQISSDIIYNFKAYLMDIEDDKEHKVKMTIIWSPFNDNFDTVVEEVKDEEKE